MKPRAVGERICPYCKVRHSENYCPKMVRLQSLLKVKKKFTKESFFGESPAPFVGRFNYPNINVGLLSPPEEKEDVWKFDAPRYWAKENYGIPDVIDRRASLVNSNTPRNVFDVRRQETYLQIAQEAGMASKPIELEVDLEKKPVFRLNVDPFSAPTGPNAKLKKADLTSNPKIHTKVDKVYSQDDLKANEAINYLYKSEFDENFLSRMLSVGTMGVQTQRKLVPTRWSITAVDDTIGKNILKEIKDYPETDYMAFFGGYLGNHFLVMLFPDVWSYELFETYSHQNTIDIKYTTDYEPYKGRKYYVDETAGGYYAARLPILEKLKEMKRQASVLALRFITAEYDVPLGVWVVREAMRAAMNSRPIKFESKELMLNYAETLASKKMGIDINKIKRNSILLKELRQQRKLFEFG